jgi:hypothetical protein
MTLQLTPAGRTVSTFQVVEIEPGFWVANNEGAFAGTIDRSGTHFFLRDCFDRYLGDYPSLQIAKARLQEHFSALARG